MKIESTDKGMSLIILLGIIVALGIIGAGIVSFMDVKQRSYPVAVKSYQALNLANAGVEFAIRYANDQNNNPANPGFPNAFLYNTSAYIASPPNWTTINFGNGNFQINYNSTTNTLISRGICGIATREVSIKSFLAYALTGGLTLVPGAANLPHQGEGANKEVHIPLMNNFDADIYLFRIDISLLNAGSNDCLQDINVAAGQVYDYTLDTSNPYYKKNNGICLPQPDNPPDPSPQALFRFNMGAPPYYVHIPANSIFTDVISFKSSARNDIYYVTLYYSLNSDLSSPQTSIVIFRI
jgi:hypothetical protein